MLTDEYINKQLMKRELTDFFKLMTKLKKFNIGGPTAFKPTRRSEISTIFEFKREILHFSIG